MKQYTGPDTVINEFIPSRANPVVRRASRKYYCQQTLVGSKDFSNMSFKIEQTNPRFCIGEMRLVLPIMMKAKKIIGGDGEVDSLNMHENQRNSLTNIALSAHAPWSAFSSMEIGINGKIYSKQWPRFSEMLGVCHNSFGEMSFADNDSLKPITNTFRGRREYLEIKEDEKTTRELEITQFDPVTFSIIEANRGFSSRRRAFLEDLRGNGAIWEGKISAPFNAALFNAQARKEGANDIIPYVRTCFVNINWDTNMDMAEQGNQKNQLYYGSGENELHLPRHVRTLGQKLFNFLTPFNGAFPNEDRSMTGVVYPDYMDLQWWGKPYIEIDWLEYKEPLLKNVYRLRYAQYQLEKTLPFAMDYTNDIDDRNWYTKHIQRQLLQVPNLIYIWAQPTKDSIQKNWIMGGSFRTLDIKNLRIRVNGNIDVISDESKERLYQWFKRNSSNQLEFDVWQKCPIICISPSEIGLSEFLENDAKLHTIDIQADCAFSPLMHPEYKYIQAHDNLESVGHAGQVTSEPILNLPELQIHAQQEYPAFDDYEDGTQLFLCPSHGDTITEDMTQFVLILRATNATRKPNMGLQSAYNAGAFSAFENLFYQGRKYNTFFGGDKHDAEQIVIKGSSRHDLTVGWHQGFTYWIQFNKNTHQVRCTDNEDKSNNRVIIYAFGETYQFNIDRMQKSYPQIEWKWLVDNDLTLNKSDAKLQHVPNGTLIDGTTEVSAMNGIQQAARNDLMDRLKSAASVGFKPLLSDDTTSYQKMIAGGYGPQINAGLLHGASPVFDKAPKMWTIGPQYCAFTLRETVQTAYNSRLVGDVLKPVTETILGRNGGISAEEAKAGWRWVKMSDPEEILFPDTGFHSNVNPFKWKFQTGDTATYYSGCETVMFDKITVGRRVVGSQGAVKVNIDNPLKHGTPITFRPKSHTQVMAEHDAAHSDHIEPRFELCTLFEYSKQSAIVSPFQKPLHQQNLVATE